MVVVPFSSQALPQRPCLQRPCIAHSEPWAPGKGSGGQRTWGQWSRWYVSAQRRYAVDIERIVNVASQHGPAGSAAETTTSQSASAVHVSGLGMSPGGGGGGSGGGGRGIVTGRGVAAPPAPGGRGGSVGAVPDEHATARSTRRASCASAEVDLTAQMLLPLARAVA